MRKLKHKPKKLNHRKNRETALAKLAAAVDKYGLTERKRRFVEEYFRTGDLAESARTAGYAHSSAGVRANEIMRQEGAQVYLQDLRVREMETAGITKHKWLKEMKALGFMDMADYASWGPDGIEMFDSKGLGEKTKAVKSLKERTTTTVLKDGGEIVRTEVDFQLHDKRAALLDIGQHFGWLKKAPCEGGNGGIHIHDSNVILGLTDEQLLHIASGSRGGTLAAPAGQK